MAEETIPGYIFLGERELQLEHCFLEVSVFLFEDMLPFSEDPFRNSYPQLCDDLLEDMDLATMRSGGNMLTWPLKIVDLKEIKDLHEERYVKRSKVH